MNSNEACKAFRDLHRTGNPLILTNIWDAGSAKAACKAGASALATSSWAVAAAQGLDDGEAVALDFIVENLARIRKASGVPVSSDVERGYGETLDELGTSMRHILATGVAGCNVEDSHPQSPLRRVDDQTARIAAIRTVADATTAGFFINARTDLFLQAAAGEHADEALVNEAIERAHAWRNAGADGFFVPGLTDPAYSRRSSGPSECRSTSWRAKKTSAPT